MWFHALFESYANFVAAGACFGTFAARESSRCCCIQAATSFQHGQELHQTSMSLHGADEAGLAPDLVTKIAGSRGPV